MTEIETNSWSDTDNMMLINRNASVWKNTVECYQKRSLESLSHSPRHHMLSLMPVPDLQLHALVTMYFRGTEKNKTMKFDQTSNMTIIFVSVKKVLFHLIFGIINIISFTTGKLN